MAIEKTLTRFYTNEFARRYTNAIKRAVYFAFEFPTEYSDWTHPDLNKMIYGYKHQFEDIANSMKEANIPDDIIQDFLRHAVVIPDYRKKIKEAEEKRRAERQSRMNWVS